MNLARLIHAGRSFGRLLVARRARMLVRAFLFAVVALTASPLVFEREASTQTQGDMEGWHPVGIENETQRKLFFSLICTCGCPRETLGTCNCNVAHARREMARGELAAGKTVEEIQAAYAKRWGPQALAVPPNVGINWLLWAVPLTAIALGAIAVILILRRWRARGEETAARGVPLKTVEHDDYDDKLDRELKDLDRE